MKKILIVIGALSLTACSSPKVSGFKELEYMQRPEVIQASKDCINAKMKPVIQNVPQNTKFGKVMLPVLVNCESYPNSGR